MAVQIKKAKKATIGAEANPRNNKKHPARQIALLVENIVELGLTTPIIVDENGMILAGHGRHLAAQKLKLPEIPAIRLSHLTEAQKRVLAISDNRISELGRWDLDRLAIELGELSNPALEVNLDIALTGFDTVEIDEILMPTIGRRPAGASELTARSASGPVITRLGDIWVCGDHILACGGPLDAAPYEKIFAADRRCCPLTGENLQDRMRADRRSRELRGRDLLFRAVGSVWRIVRNSRTIFRQAARPDGVGGPETAARWVLPILPWTRRALRSRERPSAPARSTLETRTSPTERVALLRRDRCATARPRREASRSGDRHFAGLLAAR